MNQVDKRLLATQILIQAQDNLAMAGDLLDRCENDYHAEQARKIVDSAVATLDEALGRLKLTVIKK